MHLSLCGQMAKFVNLYPLGQVTGIKKEALTSTKRSMAFSNGQLTSVIKMISCLLPFTLCFTSMHQLCSFCLYFNSRRIHELDFLLQLACMFIAHATLFDTSFSMYQSPSPFRISYFCFTALHGMYSISKWEIRENHMYLCWPWWPWVSLFSGLFRPVHSLFIYSICLFIYIIIIFSPKRRYILCNKKFYFFYWLKYFWNLN